MAKFFPREQYPWNTPELGSAIGWIIGFTEAALAILCLIPRARWIVAIVAVLLHLGIIIWNCLGPWCNLLGFNLALMLAGAFLIWPWKQGPWVSWKQCNWPIRVATILLLIYPAGVYLNWVPGYLAYCIYVPNTPYAMLHRPGEDPKFVPMLPVPEINFPLPPGHSFAEQWFDKVRKPGDVLIIHDPRPWAEAHGMNGRQLTDFGNFPRGTHWVNRYEKEGTKNSEGDTADGAKQGLWYSWHPNGTLSERGIYVNGEEEGVWISWYPNGKKQWERRYEHGSLQGPSILWYSNGGKEMAGDYLNGEMHGDWTKWTEDGQEVHWDASTTAP